MNRKLPQITVCVVLVVHGRPVTGYYYFTALLTVIIYP